MAQQQRSPLSKRALTVTLVAPAQTPIHARHLKRIHVAGEILKAAKICAGDVLVLRSMESVEGLEQLSLEEKPLVRSLLLDEERKKVGGQLIVCSEAGHDIHHE